MNFSCGGLIRSRWCRLASHSARSCSVQANTSKHPIVAPARMISRSNAVRAPASAHGAGSASSSAGIRTGGRSRRRRHRSRSIAHSSRSARTGGRSASRRRSAGRRAPAAAWRTCQSPTANRALPRSTSRTPIYPLAFTTSADQLVLPVGIVTTLIRGDVYAWGQIMTGALLGAAPPLIIYAFLMDYYISGLTAGATKG
jgi:hypothetical protein